MTSQLIDEYIANQAQRRGDVLALGDAPNRPTFFRGEPFRLTWRQLDQAVSESAQTLQINGVGPGDAVAIQLPNVVELVVTLLACFRLGATAVPLAVQYREHEIAQCLSLAKPRLMVSADRPDRPDQMLSLRTAIARSEASPQLVEVGLITSLLRRTVDDPGVANPGAPAPNTNRDPSAIATICWTSGTTGVAKGVPRNHSMWLASGQFQVDRLGLGAQDKMLCPFPVVNMAGIGGMIIPWLQSGATLFLHQPLDLPVFLHQVVTEGITYTVAPPPLLNMLLANPAMIDGVDLSTLTRIASGSAPLDPGMVQGWHKRGVEIINVFGSNEGAALLSTQETVPDPTNRARFFPRPDEFGIKTRLVDPATGNDIIARNTPGELRFFGPTVFNGYVGSTGDEFDDQGYFRTGDIFEWAGEASPPELLRFVDRLKDIIIRGGMNIAAAEVEAMLVTHPDISECAAVGYPDAELGERLGVFVVAAGEVTPTLESLAAHMRQAGAASYKLPEQLEVRSELPRNALGKVLKPELRAHWGH